MKPDIKERWVDALLSGDYTQGKGRLQRDGSFCCMGVLCDLYSKETGTPWVLSEGSLSIHGASGCLPLQVRVWGALDWVTVGRNPGLVTRNGKLEPMSYLNDSEGMSFSELGLLIQEQL